MLLASAPSREWSLLSSRPTTRAHDKSLCQDDSTGREETCLGQHSMNEMSQWRTNWKSWPRSCTGADTLSLRVMSWCPGLDPHSCTGADTLSLRGKISMLSLSCVREVLMRRKREQRNMPQTRHRDKPEDTEDEEGGKTQPIVGWDVWKPTRPLYTKSWVPVIIIIPKTTNLKRRRIKKSV